MRPRAEACRTWKGCGSSSCASNWSRSRHRVDTLSGRKFTFDQESRLFYDAVAPIHPREGFEKTITALEAVLPGPGSLQERLDAFRKKYVIPSEKLPAVFDAAPRRVPAPHPGAHRAAGE